MKSFMKQKKSIYAALLGVIFMLASAPLISQDAASLVADQNIREAQQLCNGISDSDKRFAKSAGYDIDKLCSSLRQFDAPQVEVSDEELVLPRKPEVTQEKKSTEQVSQLDFVSSSVNLQAFGYDLFAGEPTSFESTSRVPVSPSYILGPGDTVQVLFYGKLNESHDLEINRNGSVDFPQLGPVNLAGMTFIDAKSVLKRRISEEIIGVEASISLGELRSMQVFMLGEAYKPGTYTISALSTITNALFLSGGFSDIASLRNLQLKRAGKVVSKLDLYDLLLHGDTSGDAQLQSGDTIYIPTVKNTASINGEVRRPAIYELKDQVTAEQLIELAGGLKSRAFAKSARIYRVGNSGFMNILDVDLSTSKGKNTQIKNGDRLEIDGSVERQEMIVTLAGHVHFPSASLWREGLRVSDVIKNIDNLKPNADLDFALIHRELPPVGKIEPLFVDLRTVLSDSASSANIKLLPRDKLFIFSNGKGRAEQLAGLVEQLRLQSRSGEMARVATISGTVRSSGTYPLTKEMTLTQLIAAAGGLNEGAYTQVVELSRYDFTDQEKAGAGHFSITLSEAMADPAKDPKLQPYDVVSVRTIPQFRETLGLNLNGEVRFPGYYRFKRGETLSQVIKRAGGLTELAHIDAAVFTREQLRNQEQKQLQELSKRLRSDLAATNLEVANDGKSSVTDNSAEILRALEETNALGRLVIDLYGVLEGTVDDVVLKDGDQLTIPEYRQEVSVLGEVQHSSAHLFNRRLDIDDYIDLSGGVNTHADNKRIYIVKVDGSVALPGGSGWFRRKNSQIAPGDTIIVPLDVDRRRTLSLWNEASSVVYQLALGAAAIKSF
jgi:protein involved in polysaccharide export with SLBB domain